MKSLTDKHMETLLTSIEKDAEDFMMTKNNKKKNEETTPQQLGANQVNPAVTLYASTSGIINLRFEECNFSSRSMVAFREWMSKKALLETIDF